MLSPLLKFFFFALINQEYDELSPVEQYVYYLYSILEAQESNTNYFSLSF